VSILSNLISAEKFRDKFLPVSFAQVFIQKQQTDVIIGFYIHLAQTGKCLETIF
jgi:hypothetical protein